MYGLLGYVNNDKTENKDKPKTIITNALKQNPSLIYMNDNKDFVSSIYNNSLPSNNHLYEEENLSIFFIGNCFNLKEVQDHFSLTLGFLPEIIFEIYKKNLLEELLVLMNGVFSLIIIDVEKKTINIISDRFGLQPLFYFTQEKHFIWSSKIQSILNLPFTFPKLSHQAIDCFMKIGHLLGDYTYFENIKQIAPASILSYQYDLNEFSLKKYWGWNQISPIQISFEDAVEETARLFLQAIKRQFIPDGNMGVSLSGGLDSRLIIAAIHTLYPDYRGFAYTFGQKGCSDMKIAKQVAQLAGWEHQFYPIDDHNWFIKRLKFILHTDGMKSIIHLHGCEHINIIKEKVSINLNGFLGGTILGGRGMNYYPKSKTKIDENLAQILYGSFAKLIDLDDDFYDISHPDILVISNRGRRFTNLGLVSKSPYLDQRRPFMDNDLVSFLFSLPREYRFKHRLFKAVALNFFTPFFINIPWQQTGFSIKKNITLFDKLKRFGLMKLQSLNPFSSPKHYSDYQNWMRTEEVQMQLKKALLNNKSPLLEHFTSSELNHFFKKYEQQDKMIELKMARLFTLYYYLKSIK